VAWCLLRPPRFVRNAAAAWLLACALWPSLGGDVLADISRRLSASRCNCLVRLAVPLAAQPALVPWALDLFPMAVGLEGARAWTWFLGKLG